jgi:hypothetical protein
MVRDRRIHEVIDEWAAAGGSWPEGSDPRDPDTSLGSSSAIDESPAPVVVVPPEDEG